MNLNMCLFLHCSVDLSLITNKHQHCSNCIMPAFMKFHNPPSKKNLAIVQMPHHCYIGTDAPGSGLTHTVAHIWSRPTHRPNQIEIRKNFVDARTYGTPEFLSIRLSAIDDLKWGVEVSNYGAFRHQCKAKNHIFGGNQANLKECLNEQLL